MISLVQYVQYMYGRKGRGFNSKLLSIPPACFNVASSEEAFLQI
jgi:hypothetical protein